jgi:hypothetical protein
VRVYQVNQEKLVHKQDQVECCGVNENVGGVVVLYNASSALGVLVLLVFSLPLPSSPSIFYCYNYLFQDDNSTVIV